MLTELLGKAGCLCQPAKEGQLKCPLIVRPTSEDVITGNLFGVLRVLQPYWWLSDLLNLGLAATRFRRQVYRRFRIELWKNRRPYPRELLPWDEGSTQVDSTITWENPPTSVFVEMKYGSEPSRQTAGDDGTHGFPSDQIVRNIRVGLLECGWFDDDRLFEIKPRGFVMILIGPTRGHYLIKKYRSTKRLRQSIPHSDRLTRLPSWPFVGELSYIDIVHVLRRQRRFFTRAERQLIDDITAYLDFKHKLVPERSWPRNRGLSFHDPTSSEQQKGNYEKAEEED